MFKVCQFNYLFSIINPEFFFSAKPASHRSANRSKELSAVDMSYFVVQGRVGGSLSLKKCNMLYIICNTF